MYGDLSWTDTAGRLLIVFCFLATGNTAILGGLLLLLENVR
jgi:hypothetical protein